MGSKLRYSLLATNKYRVQGVGCNHRVQGIAYRENRVEG